VQKSRRVETHVDPDPDAEDVPASSDGDSSKGKGKARAVYNEPRRAVAVAINGKFSLVAIGMASGALQYTPFPSGSSSSTPASVQIQVPTPYSRSLGPVCTMEWSGDGYVLAVGWRDGWAIFSVGGRCLAKGFGVEDVDTHVDGSKYVSHFTFRAPPKTVLPRFQDSFMFGVRNLVR
jgi:hypothetical protein